jgi:hypothetical protein
MKTQHIDVKDRTAYEGVRRTIWLHSRRDTGEFGLHFTGFGALLAVDLPVSVIPELIAALEAVRADHDRDMRKRFEAAAGPYAKAIQGEATT